VISKEENQLLTQIGPGTVCGALLRRYWQPIALSEELPGSESAPIPVRILGEDLVLFRNETGRPGLLGLHCPHRGADLSYGRVESGGLRCIYHGWLFDVSGECLEQPAEPEPNNSKCKIKHASYPCQEVANIIFCYMGPGDPPLLPAYELFSVPEEYRYLPSKSYHECSYLQGNEGNLDPAHLSFLHRISGDVKLTASKITGTGLSRTEAHALNRQHTSPKIDVEITDFGLRIYTARSANPDQTYIRITNFVMPNLCAIGGGTGGDGFQVDWHVPIDDTHHWKYTMAFRRSAPPMDKELKDRREVLTKDYRRLRNASNRYLQDRNEMTRETFSGLGKHFLIHDAWAVESQGPIQDRTKEHLSQTDKAILAARKLILKAIRDVEDGRDPMHVLRRKSENHFSHLFVRHEIISNTQDWKHYWRKGGLK
jgi:phthalate 4,5-dioxygenase